jgi:hypothetical protein
MGTEIMQDEIFRRNQVQNGNDHNGKKKKKITGRWYLHG